MTERTVFGSESEGFLITISDEARTAVPYPAVTHSRGVNHGFVDLGANPHVIPQIHEVKWSPPLQELLVAVNAQHTGMMTLGCAFSVVEPSINGPRWHAMAYVGLTYRDAALNDDPDVFVDLSKKLHRWIEGSPNLTVAFEMRVEPLKIFFGLDGRYQLLLQPHGLGETKEIAKAALNFAASSLTNAVRRLSAPAKDEAP